jgi:hypothetical protein
VCATLFEFGEPAFLNELYPRPVGGLVSKGKRTRKV